MLGSRRCPHFRSAAGLRALPAASILIFSALTSSSARAQTPQPAPSGSMTTPQNRTAAQAAPISSPANNATGNPAAQAPIPIPPPPSVDDPMLAPIAPAQRVISTWPEALNLIRANSTDLKIAYDEVARAEAQYRSALAGTLPSLTSSANIAHNFLVDHVTNPLTGEVSTVPAYNTSGGNIVASQPLF